MSSLIGPNFRFLHMPKTGGTWVYDVITRWLQIPHLVDHRLGGHTTLVSALGSGLPTLVYVRNPFDWYESYYRYQCMVGWDAPAGQIGMPVRMCGYRGVKFSNFMETVLDRHPHWLTELTNEYTSFRKPDALVTVGRHERLAQDLANFLDAREVKYDRALLFDRATYLTNLSKPMPIDWSASLIARVKSTHQELLDTFGYATPI